MTKKILVTAAGLFFCGCGTTSYGVRTDGVFPPRPRGADYPNWEYLCVPATKGKASETLNDSGKQGWELAALGRAGETDLMCFKRPKTIGQKP